jgi:hypothetical protein
MKLLPCPMCGAGETRVDEKYLPPKMSGPGALISVAIHHWCNDLSTAIPGVIAEHREVRGRDHASAEAAYNRRPTKVNGDRHDQARSLLCLLRSR